MVGLQGIIMLSHGNVPHLQTYGPSLFPRPQISPIPENIRFMLTIRSPKSPTPVTCGGLQPKKCGKGNDAPPAVPAHHPAGTVGIVIVHREVEAVAPGAEQYRRHQRRSDDHIFRICTFPSDECSRHGCQRPGNRSPPRYIYKMSFHSFSLSIQFKFSAGSAALHTISPVSP